MASVDAMSKGAVFETASRNLNALRAMKVGGQRIQEIGRQWGNVSKEIRAGRVVEEIHAMSFNSDAAMKGLNQLKATTNAANGAPTAIADLQIVQGARLVDAAQIKFHATPASTAFHIADARYDGLHRVVPTDQVVQVRTIASKRSGKISIGQRNFAEVAKSASDRVRSHGAESSPLSRAEAIYAAENTSYYANTLAKNQIFRSLKSGAAIGAAVGGGISAVSNLVAYAQERKSGEAALVAVATDTATCAITGAATAGTAIIAELALARAGATALARGAAPVAIGLTTVEIAKDAYRLLSGDINGAKFARRAGTNVIKGSCTWGGMEGGAAIGSVILPGLGTVVGGFLGAIGGALFSGWITR